MRRLFTLNKRKPKIPTLRHHNPAPNYGFRHNKTRRGGNDERIDGCMKTYCAKLVRDNMKRTQKILMKMKKKMKTDPNDLTKRVMEMMEDKIKNAAKEEKRTLSGCRLVNCNPTCKDTLFEDGPGNAIPPGVLREEYAKDINVRKMLKESRIKMFKEHGKIPTLALQNPTSDSNGFRKKASVLDDGFYRGIPPRVVKKLKKEGALSSCAAF